MSEQISPEHSFSSSLHPSCYVSSPSLLSSLFSLLHSLLLPLYPHLDPPQSSFTRCPLLVIPNRSHRQTELTLLNELGEDLESESLNVVEPPELVLMLDGLESYL
jgi:hypothetical protein